MFDCNTFKDKRDLLSYARSYSCATSLCGRSPNSRQTTYLEEIAYLQYF